MPEFKEKGAAYTAFVVPTECFEPFLFFQKELTRKGGKYLDSQPNFQLVFEVPNVFTYKQGSPRRHSWMRDADLTPTRKRPKVHDYNLEKCPEF